jgi:hypothetical protein
LLGKRVVVTAAHCYDWITTGVDEPFGSFSTNARDGTPLVAMDVVQAWTYAKAGALGSTDVAFAILRQCVDNVVAPERLDTTYPPNGAQVDEFGYGCQDKTSYCATGKKPFALGEKQEVLFPLGASTDGCAGDSGGPLFDSSGLFAVLSGSWPCREASDSYGNVVAHADDFAKLQQAFPCSFEERAATVKAGSLRPLQPPASIVFDNGEAFFAPAGPYASSLVRLNYGERVLLRFVRSPDGKNISIVGFRPQGGSVVGGILRQDDNGMYLQRGMENGSEQRTRVDAHSAPAVLARLSSQIGNQVLLFGKVAFSVFPATAVSISAANWDATEGLF